VAVVVHAFLTAVLCVGNCRSLSGNDLITVRGASSVVSAFGSCTTTTAVLLADIDELSDHKDELHALASDIGEWVRVWF